MNNKRKNFVRITALILVTLLLGSAVLTAILSNSF